MKNKFIYIIWGILLLSMSVAPSQVVAAIDAPRGVVAEGGDNRYELRFWWINPNSAELDHINIYRSREPLVDFGIVSTIDNVLPNEVSSGVVASITPDTYYYFYLTAVDEEGNESEPTTTLKRRSGISLDLTSTIPVGNVSIDGIEHGSLTLNWTNPGDDDFYRTSIYRSTESSVLASVANLITQEVALPSTVTKYVDSSLEPETTYYYRLVAEDTKGNLSDSVIVSAKTLATPATPEVVESETPEVVVTPPAVDENIAVPTVMPNPALFDYRAQWVSQSGVVNDANTAHVVTATAGETVSLELTLKNIGSAWWYFESPDNAHEVKIGTWNEADRTSPFQANNWLSSNRVSMLDAVVPTGDTVTFNLSLSIPVGTTPGTYSEYFRPVSEYVEWFGPAGIFWDIQVN